MGTLQKLFEREIQASFTFPIVGAKLIKRQLEKRGVILTAKQVSNLEINLRDISGDSVTFDLDLDNEQNRVLGISDGEKIELDIGDEKNFDEFYQEFIAKLERTFPEIIEEMASLLLSDLRENRSTMLKAHRKDMKGFEKRLDKDWKRPFDLFESFLVLAFEAGDEFNSDFRKDATEVENYVLEALTRLHARACQIAWEVFVLLKSGFADGAHARWRSLHEIAVVASFIKTHGNEVAERYLLHDNIESYKAATLYQKHCQALGDEPIPQDEYNSLITVRDELIARFGNSYKNNYGWSSSALNKQDPNFSDIEENAGLDHLRPYYKLASHNVHANPKGVMFKLGLSGNTQNVLLAGPSNFGFTDPAQGTAYSLGLVTVTLITTRPTIDNLVLSNILLRLESEIGEEFLKVQKDIEDKDCRSCTDGATEWV
ncbi:MAG: hypothetical protein H6668_08230 [Ardenticatenaceae bacterium]|nr:hypothetical protein [Ardenticatenaceae bacterium]